MRGRRGGAVRSGRAGPPAPAQTSRRRKRKRKQPHALGTSAGVCGHGAARCAGGAAHTARTQTSPAPFRIGMAERPTAPSDGGPIAGDGGTGCARAVRRRRRAAWPAAEHTAARRGVRPGRASAVAGTLSARRADEKQRAASTEQVRERRARVGGRGGRGPAAGRRRGGQEGRTTAEGDALVGANGRAAGHALPAGGGAAAVRDGAPRAPRTPLAPARRVTPPPRRPLPYHAYIPLSGRSDSPERPRVPEYYRLGIYLFGSGPRAL